MSEITDKLRADAAWAGARTATTVRQIGRDCEEAADYIDRLEENRENHKRAYDESEMALAAKIQSLAPHGTCGCSYDAPDDLCDHHSPQIMALRARVAVLEGAVKGLLRCEYESAGHGLMDCIDNDGDHYQSAFLAGCISTAEAALTPVAETPNQDGKI